MEKYKIDCLIIGGGVSGLAIARNLVNSYEDIFLVEQNAQVGMETSSRNSEVIHAGIYYPHDSLKARLCVEGKNLLYEYLDKRSINYQRCGKSTGTVPGSFTETFLITCVRGSMYVHGSHDVPKRVVIRRWHRHATLLIFLCRSACISRASTPCGKELCG